MNYAGFVREIQLTRIFVYKIQDASGKEIEGSNVTKCMVDAEGKIVKDGQCAKGAASLRFTTNDVNDRTQRLWTFKFSKKLSEYGAP